MATKSYSKYALITSPLNGSKWLEMLHHCSMCVLGKRLLKDIPIENCTKEDTFLRDIYCPEGRCEEYYLGTFIGNSIAGKY